MEKEYSKDDSRDYQFDWENLKVGDYVFTDSDVGFCSGGILYGNGDLVVGLTDDEIITEEENGKSSKWDRKDRTPKQPPWAYYLGAFQSNA